MQIHLLDAPKKELMTVTIIQGLWKEGSKKKKIIVKVLVATELWKEGSKKKNLLWSCLWPCGALKFQSAFWALRPTSTNKWCLWRGVGAHIAALTTPSHFHATSVIQGHMILNCLNWFLTPTGIFRHWSITNQFHQFHKLFVPLKQVICCLTTPRKAAPYYRMLCKIYHECHH